MGHGHPHNPDHEDADVPAPLDLSIPDGELSPGDVSRRAFLRSAGLLGAGAAAVATGAFAAPGVAAADDPVPLGRSEGGHSRRNGYRWLAGDHHTHTQYSGDAVYRVIDHVRHANAYGLAWMVVTDHGSVQHAKIGVEKVNPDIRAARDAVRDTLVFQGFEWNIPAAEHGTVFVHPGKNEVAVLKEFENAFDGTVKSASDPTPANEALAISGINFLSSAVTQRGFEGAPGHQAAGIPAPTGQGSGRGYYDNSPTAASFAAYPLESYRTWGGFDWMTATVGGLWDSLLAEGKPWWITANSDSHWVHNDTTDRGPGSDFTTNGFYNDPVYTGKPAASNGDFWPGFYSRTHVGATDFSYAAVMAGLRAGRVWVDHGGLISGLDVRVRSGGQWVTLGDSLVVRRGSPVQLTITIELANGPNWAQFVPNLARVDVIRGAVTGPAADRDVFTTPATKVVKSFEVNKSTGTVSLTYDLGRADQPFYLRLRGTDGNRIAPGYLGAAVDPAGPAMDVLGSADPWTDLWFYTNPIWILPHR